MPFLATDQSQQDEEDKKDQAGQATQGQILASTAGGATAATGQSATGTTGPKGTSSGSFTNLNNYLTANKGNDGVMGAGVRSTVAGKADNATTAGTTFQDTTSKAIGEGTLKDDKGLTSMFQSVTDYAPSSPVREAPLDPAAAPKGRGGSYTVDPNAAPKTRAPAPANIAPDLTGISADDFNALWGGGYTGPTDLKGTQAYADTQKGYADVQDMAEMAGGAKANMDSRGILLDKTYAAGGQQYRPGERTLDSFILGAGDEGIAALDGINADYGKYTDNFTAISDLLAGDIATADIASKAVNADFKKAVTGANDTLTGSLETAADAREADDGIASRLAAGDLSAWDQFDVMPDLSTLPEPVQRAMAGISQRDLLSYLMGQGVDLTPFIYGAGSVGDYASDSDILNFAQLQMLLGESAPISAFAPEQLTKTGQGAGIDEAVIKARMKDALLELYGLGPKQDTAGFGWGDPYDAAKTPSTSSILSTFKK